MRHLREARRSSLPTLRFPRPRGGVEPVSEGRSWRHLFGQDEPAVGRDAQVILATVVLQDGFTTTAEQIGYGITHDWRRLFASGGCSGILVRLIDWHAASTFEPLKSTAQAQGRSLDGTFLFVDYVIQLYTGAQVRCITRKIGRAHV